MDINEAIAEWLTTIFREIGDPTGLGDHAEALRVQANQVRAVHTQIAAEVESSSWSGLDSQAFGSAWQQHANAAEDTAAILYASSQQIDQHAERSWKIVKEIIGIALEILEILAAGLALSWILAGIMDFIWVRLAPLIEQILGLVARFRAMLARFAEAVAEAGRAVGQIGEKVGVLLGRGIEKVVLELPDNARAFAGFYLAEAVPPAMSGRSVNWKDNAWQTAIFFGVDIGHNLIEAGLEATKIGKSIRGGIEGTPRRGDSESDFVSEASTETGNLAVRGNPGTRHNSIDYSSHSLPMERRNEGHSDGADHAVKSDSLDGSGQVRRNEHGDRDSAWRLEQEVDAKTQGGAGRPDAGAISLPPASRRSTMRLVSEPAAVGKHSESARPESPRSVVSTNDTIDSLKISETPHKSPGASVREASGSESKKVTRSAFLDHEVAPPRSLDGESVASQTPTPSIIGEHHLPALPHQARDLEPAPTVPQISTSSPGPNPEMVPSGEVSPVMHSPDTTLQFLSESSTPAHVHETHAGVVPYGARESGTSLVETSPPLHTSVSASKLSDHLNDQAAAERAAMHKGFEPKTGRQSLYAGLKEGFNIFLGNVETNAIVAHINHKERNGEAYALELLGGFLGGLRQGLFHGLSVGERFGYRNELPDSPSVMRWLASTPLSWSYYGMYLTGKEAILHGISGEMTPTQIEPYNK
ncbi:WXG100 family type VII secretion target [Streptomyces sp. PA03-6a]|nr:WXG100 family type VII secretion target [Streptomyces sp. PA03-6a]